MTAPVITFLGAAGTVTGSRFLIDHPDGRVLVDCGLYQGEKVLRRRNWQPFPVDPASLDAVLLTHAHVDHCGWIPRLVKEGFRGRVIATSTTVDLCRIVLPDSGHLQEEEARYANQRGYSKHDPALPLYTEEEARTALGQFHRISYGDVIELPGGFEAVFRRAGHILGSSTITMRVPVGDGVRTVVASGDLGRADHPLLLPPDPIGVADHILVESTYGNRTHDDSRTLDDLADAVGRTVERGGTVVIPAFAVDRTEVVLFHLRELMEAGRIPRVPVHVDSPMALASLEVYRRALADDGHELRPQRVRDPFDTGTLHEVHDREESAELDRGHVPSIIVSASGMATGGRVLHHLKARLPDHRSTVVLVGFQAAGTRGRALAEGARQIKLLGRYIPVRAHVRVIDGLSVHADRDELLAWLRTATGAPTTVFTVHGEPQSSAALADAVATTLGWPAVVPVLGERVRLD